MNDKQNPNSRSNRFEKKRKGTMLFTWLVGAGSLLIIVLIGLFIFGGDDTESIAKDTETVEDTNNGDNSDATQNDDHADEESNENSDNSNSNDLVVTEENKQESNEKNKKDDSETSSEGKDDSVIIIESSDNENVKRIVKKDWDPVQTQQDISGEHRITYDKASQDWAEMLTAIRQVTGLTEQNMITKWIGNGGGPNKAVATVYNSENKNEVYRVHLQWLEGTGFQVQKVEELINIPETNS